ncbi:MAG: type II toxin-antitoxin system Phd/YefM family antitoxin [Hyphomicrobiaceae bacterium]|nr:type II toxin-antitoxin system Phd/YefM family antitoxin [Hyphomicrobiaceae bacterium]
MATYTVHQAKTQLSKLIEQAERGEEVVIARGDKPAVKLVPVPTKHSKRIFGAYKGEFEVPDSFFEPLPEEELAAFEGEYSTDPISVEERQRTGTKARPKR